jgi:hypothetical protein
MSSNSINYVNVCIIVRINSCFVCKSFALVLYALIAGWEWNLSKGLPRTYWRTGEKIEIEN